MQRAHQQTEVQRMMYFSREYNNILGLAAPARMPLNNCLLQGEGADWQGGSTSTGGNFLLQQTERES